MALLPGRGGSRVGGRGVGVGVGVGGGGGAGSAGIFHLVLAGFEDCTRRR